MPNLSTFLTRTVRDMRHKVEYDVRKRSELLDWFSLEKELLRRKERKLQKILYFINGCSIEERSDPK